MKRVMVVEDSATARRHVVSVLALADDLEVVALARTGDEAVRAAAALLPDIISLDVYLPDMSAADVVRRIHEHRPTPILLLSDAQRNAADVFQALEAGAIDFLPKPKVDNPAGARAVLTAMRHLSHQGDDSARGSRRAPGARSTPAVVAIASSTGGPPALKAFLSTLPANFPWPVLIAQHLTPGFEDGLSRWLGQHCALPVRVVNKTTTLAPGVFIGLPEHDLLVHSRSEVRLVPAPARGYHPSGDQLFETAVAAFGAQVVAVVMSGIGSDGLRGATLVQSAGGLVLAQSHAPVRGMPESILKAGLAAGEGSPEQLGARLSALAQGRPGRES